MVWMPWTELGMATSDNRFVPLMSTVNVAPDSLLKVIHYNSSTACKTLRCSCRKHGLFVGLLLSVDHVNFRNVTIHITRFFFEEDDDWRQAVVGDGGSGVEWLMVTARLSSRTLAPPESVSKCPWARHWTPNCSWCAGWCPSWLPPPSVYECVCEWVNVMHYLCEAPWIKAQ